MITPTTMSIKWYILFPCICFSTTPRVHSLRNETTFPDCYRLCNETLQVKDGSECNKTSNGGSNDLCITEMNSSIDAYCKTQCRPSSTNVQDAKIMRGKLPRVILHYLIVFAFSIFMLLFVNKKIIRWVIKKSLQVRIWQILINCRYHVVITLD